jgi:hypothetical protein
VLLVPPAAESVLTGHTPLLEKVSFLCLVVVMTLRASYMRENDDDEARKLTVNEQSTREGRHTWKEHGSGNVFCFSN